MAVIDATTLLLFLRPNTPVPAAIDRPLDRVNFLVSTVEKAKSRLIIPTPALAEVLVRATAAEAAELLEKINKYAVFSIQPFDIRAAIEVAAMTRSSLDSGGKKAKRTSDSLALILQGNSRMSRTDHPADMTYPPEMLPCAAGDEDAEIAICCGGDKCSGGKPCGSLIVLRPNERQARPH